MALFLFTKAIIEGRADVFNGRMQRDFTYIDDTLRVLTDVRKNSITGSDWDSDNPNPSTSAPYRVYNIGNNDPIELSVFIETIENALGMQARKTCCRCSQNVPATMQKSTTWRQQLASGLRLPSTWASRNLLTGIANTSFDSFTARKTSDNDGQRSWSLLNAARNARDMPQLHGAFDQARIRLSRTFDRSAVLHLIGRRTDRQSRLLSVLNRIDLSRAVLWV